MAGLDTACPNNMCTVCWMRTAFTPASVSGAQVWACPQSENMPANCLSFPEKCPFEEYGFKAAGLKFCKFEIPGTDSALHSVAILNPIASWLCLLSLAPLISNRLF